jgi:hypothetical protein
MRTDGPTGRRWKMKKVICAFRNFANSPKRFVCDKRTPRHLLHSQLLSWGKHLLQNLTYYYRHKEDVGFASDWYPQVICILKTYAEPSAVTELSRFSSQIDFVSLYLVTLWTLEYAIIFTSISSIITERHYRVVSTPPPSFCEIPLSSCEIPFNSYEISLSSCEIPLSSCKIPLISPK